MMMNDGEAPYSPPGDDPGANPGASPTVHTGANRDVAVRVDRRGAGRVLEALQSSWESDRKRGVAVPTDVTWPVGAIRVEARVFQPREFTTDAAWVGKLRGELRRDGELDPVVVLWAAGEAILVDGHHRLEAYRAEGRELIPVVFFGGDPQEAAVFSRRENRKERRGLTLGDRFTGAWGLVLMTQGGTRGEGREALARNAGVSEPTITKMRDVKARLGRSAARYSTWREAREADPGRPAADRDYAGDEWKVAQAAAWAGVLGRSKELFGMKKQPEVAAMALAEFFGERTGEVVRHLMDHSGGNTGDDDPGDDDDNV